MSPVTKKLNGAAQAATNWIGSISSLLVHTALFIVSFSLVFFGFNFEQILLTVTTIVSLEAIYLAIFIQMAINQNSQSLEEVEEDIDEIQEKVVEIHKDVDEIERDVDEIQKDVDEIQEDVGEDDMRDKEHTIMLDKIGGTLAELMKEIEKMKNGLR